MAHECDPLCPVALAVPLLSDAVEPAQEELDGGPDPAGLQRTLQAQRDHRQGDAGAGQEL